MAFQSGIVFILYAIHTSAAKTTLSAELTNLIPACAQSCFTSFLDFNFALTKCGINPTLDCLCTTNSASGYTVGEGAVQCVLTTAACSSGESQDVAAFKAYTMCDGTKGALPKTHATLTATLIGSSTTTAARSTSRSNFSASTVITASTTDASTLPSTLITSTYSLSASTTSISVTSSSSPEAEAVSQVSEPTTKLSRNQTIGIGVGSSIGAIAIMGLIIFACLRRRKFQRPRDSDMLPFQMDPSNDLNYNHGFKTHMGRRINGPGGTPNGVAGKVVPKIPMRIDTQSPNMFSRRSLKSDIIGIAISPDAKQQRRSSKLLPEKPNLTLVVPADKKGIAGLSYPQRTTGASITNGRQSTATQFEEDFDSADTAVAADDSWGRGTDDHLLPPSGNLAIVGQESAPPVLPIRVTGGSDGNNWRPRQPNSSTTTSTPEVHVKPLQLARGPIGSFSQPRRPEEYHARSQSQSHQQKQPLKVLVPNQGRFVERPITGSSSVYSAHDSLPGSENVTNDTRAPAMPRTRRSYKASGQYDRMPRHQSSGSQTSFETNDSALASPQDAKPVLPQLAPQPQSQYQNQRPILAPINTNPTNNSDSRRTVMLDLSPVVESPPSGRSPVSYPKIPARGRLPEHTIRMVPPPAQPDFNAVFYSGRYANNDRFKMANIDRNSPNIVSPVLASPTPIESATAITPMTEGKMKPWRVAEINAQRERERMEREKGEMEPISAVEIEIGMINPPPLPQSASVQLQPFRAGTGQIWPQQGNSNSNSNMGPLPPRIQPQQRRPQQPYLAPSVQFNQNNKTLPNPGLQQQLSSSYQAFDPSKHGIYQQRSSTAPLPTQTQMQGGRTLSPMLSHPSFAPTRSSSVSSSASSLLAKRRGEQKEKALALNLAHPQKSQNSSSTPQKWRVLDEDGKEKAKSEAWRPKIGTVENGKAGYEVFLGSGSGTNGGLGTGDLPKTPGWVPKLTPTRRGDELFLSVA